MKKDQVDKSVIALLQKVREKKEAIKKSQSRPQWKTNCSYGNSSEPAHRVNIQTVRDENKLIGIAAEILWTNEKMNEAANLIGLKYNDTVLGFSVADWLNDLKTRANMLNIEKQKKEIEELDKRINKLVSSEQRREMELVELQALLAD